MENHTSWRRGKKKPPQTLLKQTTDREKAMQYIFFPSYVRANPICELYHLSDSHYLLFILEHFCLEF